MENHQLNFSKLIKVMKVRINLGAHYIVLNHGDGNNYYQVVVRFPFWGGNVQIGHREKNVWNGWKNIGDCY